MIIGLSGYARSGKDEAAKVLVEEFGFTRVAFADKLREVLYQLNPRVQVLFQQPELGSHKWWHIQDVIDKYGWDGYKDSPFSTEIRRLLQRLGTEAGRLTLWDSIWIDAAFAGVPPEADVVVTDCRFPNEAEAIVNRQGAIWRIVRKGVGPANLHPSETSLDDWKFHKTIENDSTLEVFRERIARAWCEDAFDRIP